MWQVNKTEEQNRIDAAEKTQRKLNEFDANVGNLVGWDESRIGLHTKWSILIYYFLFFFLAGRRYRCLRLF